MAMPRQMTNAGSTMIAMPASMVWTDPGIIVMMLRNLGQGGQVESSLVQRAETVRIRPELIHQDEHEDQPRDQAPEEGPALIHQMHEIHHRQDGRDGEKNRSDQAYPQTGKTTHGWSFCAPKDITSN